MHITRRNAIKLAALGAASPSVLLIEGCPTAQQWFTTIANDLPTLISIATSIAQTVALAEGQSQISSAVAAAITTASNVASAAIAGLQSAVVAYDGGKGQGTVAQIADALSTAQQSVSKIVAALPAGSVDTDLVAALNGAIGTLELTLVAISVLIPPASTTTTPAIQTVVPEARVQARATIAKSAKGGGSPNTATLASLLNVLYADHGFPKVSVGTQ